MSLAFRPMIEALGYLRANALSYTGIPGLKFDYLEREQLKKNIVNRGFPTGFSGFGICTI